MHEPRVTAAHLYGAPRRPSRARAPSPSRGTSSSGPLRPAPCALARDGPCRLVQAAGLEGEPELGCLVKVARDGFEESQRRGLVGLGASTALLEEPSEREAGTPAGRCGIDGGRLGLRLSNARLTLCHLPERDERLALRSLGVRHEDRALWSDDLKPSCQAEGLVQAILADRVVGQRQQGPRHQLDRVTAPQKRFLQVTDAGGCPRRPRADLGADHSTPRRSSCRPSNPGRWQAFPRDSVGHWCGRRRTDGPGPQSGGWPPSIPGGQSRARCPGRTHRSARRRVLLCLRHAADGLPGGRSLRLRARSAIPEAAAQSLSSER